jgi:CO/xanthine dehydrogenase Mo-binding subunit
MLGAVTRYAASSPHAERVASGYGYVAIVAEVAVDQASGGLSVTRLMVAQDCGPIEFTSLAKSGTQCRTGGSAARESA